jgi:hypothetical protein
MQYPLVEIGYAKRCIDRLKEHAQHDKPNDIMNLSEAMFGVIKEAVQVSTLYRINQAISCLIWLPGQGEISFTELAEYDIHNTGGFSHFPAGLSNHSANTISARESSGAKEYLVKHSAFRENQQA